jgi:hypothetical protein
MNEVVKVRSEYPPTVPLSVLALNLAEPAEGWPNFLGRRAITIIPDDLGRDSVTRGDARRLLDEQREVDLRQAARRRLAEQEAVEADQARRAQIWGGVRADRMPSDALPAAVMLRVAQDSQPRRQSVLQHALSHEDGMVFHSFEPASPEDAS